tara:strand:- start:2436 stop:3806 length:1371 start_codon:yes stop_codon:yes gene_type:complete
MSIQRVLIANRGEIAVRIQRSCKKMGINTVQAYSEADRESLAVKLADQSVDIGGSAPTDGYLSIKNLIQAAKDMGCDAVHPGYGFLSESCAFAEACIENGLTFIGPQASVIKDMGDKSVARKIASEAGIPVIPGSDGPITDPVQALELARSIGYPLLIKASAGGGGRGMRVVNSEEELKDGLISAAREAKSAFSSADVYLEKYLERVRHVEVQIIGDGVDVIHLGERDCSIQRRHQKLLEECPSPVISDAQREHLTDAACRLAKAVGYKNAGTVEFVMDIHTDNFYFIEMNTRIQVEHPVTEAITGVDIVNEQILIAGGEGMTLKQEDVNFTGHAIECRINAENPEKGFLPKPGTLSEFIIPVDEGVRVDTHAYQGYELPTYYDSLLAKIITHGKTREDAIEKMQKTLKNTLISGVPTTVSFHQRLLSEPDFINNNIHTRYLKETMWAGNPMQHLL